MEEFEFVYQVNCVDLPDADVLGLPQTGLLSVFACGEPSDGGKLLYFPSPDLVRHRMPDPVPDYVFSNVKPWTLKVTRAVGFAEYGDDLYDEIDEAELTDQYEKLVATSFDKDAGPCFGELLGRFSDLNGDMREDAADECGGEPGEWRSLWKVFSSWESGLVISDFHLLHGMIRARDLKALDFSSMFTTQDNG